MTYNTYNNDPKTKRKEDGKSKHRFVTLTSIAATALLVSGIAAAAPMASVDNGVLEMTPENVDTLLELDRSRDLRVLELTEGPKDRLVSEAHVQELREWIENGGVLWVAHEGLQSALVRNLANFEVTKYKYKKVSTGKTGGELVVRGVKPDLRINDHPLTRNVEQLYVYPRWSFEGSTGTTPLLEMTDKRGKYGQVISAIEMGRGYLVLDGTARDENFLFNRIPGFNEDYINAVQIDDEWRNYDWPQLRENALQLSDPSFSMSGHDRYQRRTR